MKKHSLYKSFLLLGLMILIFSLVSISHLENIINQGTAADIQGKLSGIFNNKVKAQSPQTLYVANTPEECGNFTPCYTNTDGLDDINGQGTGLRDAVVASNDGDEVIILGTYTIKDHTVLIDKNLTIRGDLNSQISYPGSNCGLPMLSFTAGGTIKELTITGGDCAGLSRDLITISAPQDFNIEHNTLQGGNRAVNIKSNDGNVTVAFNQITQNTEYAIYQGKGTAAGTLSIYANNIHDNRDGPQVNCNNLGAADHNFWGENNLPVTMVEYCEAADEKRLGAPILVLPDSPGVQAVRQTVSDNFSYAFESNIGVKRNTGNNFDLIIVNHGQGTEENIPFLNSGATPIAACSNFFDVFLTEGAVASDLVMTIKYDLNDSCMTAVESGDFCGQDDESKYPLWWFDPADNLTDGWDRTGQIPAGDNPLIVGGQTTTCNIAENEIQVVIDGSGRPGIGLDLNYTPFIAGLPIGSIDISALSANFDVDQVDVYWESGLEKMISGFYVLRAGSETGPFYRISQFIPSNGSNSIYEFTDSLNTVEFNKNYYYKIEVINTYGDTLRTHGPVSILTSTPTPSPTPTRTLYPTRTPYPTSTSGPTRTATQYIYRSPTSFYRPRTATPFSTPTQVRTDRPTPTSTQTLSTEQMPPAGATEILGTNQVEGTPTRSNTPEVLTEGKSLTPSPASSESVEETPGVDSSENPEPSEDPSEPGQVRWGYLLLGAGSGIGVLIAAGVILSKFYF